MTEGQMAYVGYVTNRAVGSHRYKVTVKTQGGLPHTREEWVDLDSIEDGFKIAMGIIMRYFS